MTTIHGGWLTLPLAFASSWAVIALRLRFADHGLDRPNHRSLHVQPTPHGGGLGIVFALLVAGVLLNVSYVLLTAVLGLALLSLVDDIVHLPFWLRLAAHLCAAATLCVLIDLPAWLWPPAMLAVTWMTNLYNFMDGADGLSATQGIVGFATLAVGFALAGDSGLASWCAAAVGACAGFLRFNWPPAKIFMGDVGSIPLGFLAGSLGAWGIWRDAWPLWFPILAFAPFILDASVTLLRRTIARKRIWEAHREHAYQCMVAMGYGHRGMTLRWGTAMLCGSLLAVALLAAPAWLQWTGGAAWLGALLSLENLIQRRSLSTHTPDINDGGRRNIDNACLPKNELD